MERPDYTADPEAQISAQELGTEIAGFGRERDRHLKAARAKLAKARSGLEAAKAQARCLLYPPT